MLTSEQLRLKQSAYEAFRRVRETYEKIQAIHVMSLSYNGYNGTHHGSAASGDEVSRTCRDVLVERWRHKLDLELANLLTHGVDASSEMPREDV